MRSPRVPRAVLAGLACLMMPAQPAAASCGPWPDWERFKQHHLEGSGRVVDRSTDRQLTVSEGQAYALWFALVADDVAAFESILGWTRDNLARGDLAARLPAWKWGRRDDGAWGVLDDNAAADADLWLAYTLLEAGQVWRHTGHAALGAALARRILSEETAVVPGLGLVLLPGPRGFANSAGWRLNPSYSPLQLLRGLHVRTGERRWSQMALGTERLLRSAVRNGHAPDWVEWRAGGGVVHGDDARGGYDAIRVYLWAGMLAPGDPARPAVLRALRPLAHRVAQSGVVPEFVHLRDGAAQGAGPPGFAAAILPLLRASGFTRAAETQRRRAEVSSDTPAYYSDALRLFGLGWWERRYRFDRRGSLLRAVETGCETRV